MTTLPNVALSVRQPWAWAILHAGKDIENRAWRPANPAIRFRGRIAVHASKGMTQAEYADASEFMARIGVNCPEFGSLQRGGIVGSVTIVNAVGSSASPWFFGPVGLVLEDPTPTDFIPSIGALGVFRWSPSGPLPAPEQRSLF